MKLGAIAKVRPGFHFRGTAEPDPAGEYRLIQVRDLDRSGRVDPDALTRVQPDRSASDYLLEQGDVLYLSRGVRQFATPIREALEKTIAPNHFFIVRLKTTDVLPDYLSWYLNSPEAQASLRTLTQGTNVPYISKGELEELDVPVPRLEVQQRIVALADLVEEEKRLLRALEEERERLVAAVCIKAAHSGSD